MMKWSGSGERTVKFRRIESCDEAIQDYYANHACDKDSLKPRLDHRRSSRWILWALCGHYSEIERWSEASLPMQSWIPFSPKKVNSTFQAISNSFLCGLLVTVITSNHILYFCFCICSYTHLSWDCRREENFHTPKRCPIISLETCL